MTTRIRFLQTGDIHVGRNRLSLGEAGSNERSSRLLDTLYRVARDNKCSGVLITGDIFDTKSVTNAERELVAAKLSMYAGRDGIATYVIAGNHDQTTRGSGNLDYLAEIAKTGEVANLHVSFAVQDVVWESPEPGLSIIGAPCEKSEDQFWVEEYVSKLPKDQQFIFMGHGTIKGCMRNDAGYRPDEAKDKKLSLTKAAESAPNVIWWAYGDIHKRQKLPTLPKGSNGWYAGSPIQMDFGETADRGVVIVAFDLVDGAWEYTGQRYVRIDTPENGFAPFVTIMNEDQIDATPTNALMKIDKAVTLSTERMQQVIRTFKVLENRSLPELPDDLVAAKVDGGGLLEAVDPLLSSADDVEEDVLSAFSASDDVVMLEAKRSVRAAIDRFRNRTYLS